MIGLNFNEEGKEIYRHTFPEETEEIFDMLVESLPTKDETKSDMIAKLYKDESDNLYWEYIKRPKTTKERLDNLEESIGIKNKNQIVSITEKINDLENRIEALENR